jgi:hypothetical protein
MLKRRLCCCQQRYGPERQEREFRQQAKAYQRAQQNHG